MPDPVLSIRELTVEFHTEDGVVHAVNDVNYDLFPGETLGIVGESGSGKSVSVMTMLGLIPQPPGKVVKGEALYGDRDLLTLPANEMREIRGGEIAMIFQDPDDVPEPGLHDREADLGSDRDAQPGDRRQGGDQANDRAARAGRASRSPNAG